MHLTVVGTIGQDCAVLLVDEFTKNLAVVNIRGRGLGLDDELTLQVHFGVIFIAVMGLVVFLCPASFAIFLSAHGWIGVEFFGAFAIFDLLVLFAGVALAWRIREAGVNDAALAGNESFAF